MPFGFGGSSSSSQSSGQSSSSSQSTGSSSSLTGSRSDSISRGESTGRAGSSGFTQQNVAFQDIFAQLFGGASGAAAGLDPSMLTQAANQLFSGGMDFLGNIGGDVGTDFLQNRLGSENTVLDDQIGLLQEDIGRLFSEELNPAITSEAVGAGALGGGRQGVAQGIAAGRAGDAFARGAAELRAGDISRRDAIAGGLADRSLAGAQIGLAGGQQLAGIAELGFGADLAPYERLAAILGDPTVLSQSQSESFSFQDALDFARSFSDSFGVSQSADQSSSQSQATHSSTSKGRSANIGFSFGGG